MKMQVQPSTTRHHLLFCSICLLLTMVSCQSHVPVQEKPFDKTAFQPFLNDLKFRTFNFFWDIVDTNTWQNDDRYPTQNFTSIAATGFALPAYIIGVENKYISRSHGAARVLKALQWLWASKQASDTSGATGYRGLYYHFLNYQRGDRFKDVELSTIDTGLLFGGILCCQSYFDGENETEQQIRQLADSLYLRVEWDWAMNNQQTMSMGWKPESGFLSSSWTGYNEAMLLVVLGLGSPTHPIPYNAWENWCKTYEWADFYGYSHVNFGPLFGHQYSQMFIDFRDIVDPYMQEKGLDYFENSRRATLSNRAYCIDNPLHFNGYSENIWGLTACDGPAFKTINHNGIEWNFKEYNARGAAHNYTEDDGTIAPTAAGGSIPFAPEYCIPALSAMRDKYGVKLYQQYGFKDAFNVSIDENGWFAVDYLGIDQGAILIQLENHETGLIWEQLRKNKYIINGLLKAGFTGGWLDAVNKESTDQTKG